MVMVEGCFHKPMHYFVPGTLEMGPVFNVFTLYEFLIFQVFVHR